VLQLAQLTPVDFQASLDGLTGVYAAAMNPPPAQLPGRRAIMERHAGYADFRAIVATLTAGDPHGPVRAHGGPVIGFAYGFHGESGQWWHDLVYGTLAVRRGRQSAEDWLGDSFEIAEVHVLPDHQGHGTGRAMMLQLTGGRRERTAVLSTMDSETRAHRLYRWLGFTDLIPGFAFPGADLPYSIMGATLPLPG
jgi:ribosomal protein S18 acetylase RimI-like enzyme